MIPIYIIHYDKLTERRKYLSKALKQMDAAFVVHYGKEYLKQEHLDMYDPNEETWNKQCRGLYKEVPPFAKLTKGMISCSVGHIKTLKHISYRGVPCLILEDDAVLCDNFQEELDKVLETMKEVKWDVVFIGGAFPHDICPTMATHKNLLLKNHPASNTVCSYIVSPDAAFKLWYYLKNFTLPIDFAMNYVMKELNMKVWHVSPYLIREGTSAGIYKSSQERT